MLTTAATFYGLAHTARDEMNAGRLTADQASDVLSATVRGGESGAEDIAVTSRG